METMPSTTATARADQCTRPKASVFVNGETADAAASSTAEHG